VLLTQPRRLSQFVLQSVQDGDARAGDGEFDAYCAADA
jgi:hypothetical protein